MVRLTPWEVSMERQLLLPLAINEQVEVLRRLWERIPEQNRRELETQYARLIAQAARDASRSPEEEPSREIIDQ